jgi:dipeptidyl aminopeptidase/acylaminoacyl peptidase
VDLYVLTLADKSVKTLVDSYGPESNPVWSPDSRQIAFTTANGSPEYYYRNSRIAVVPADGGPARVIAADFDEDPRLIEWGPAGLYFQGMQRTHVHLFQANPATGQWRRALGDESFSLMGASFSRDFKTVLVMGARPNEFPEFYVTPATRLEPRALTDYAAQYKDFKLARRELIRWKSKDGTEIEGVLIKPADYDPAKKYPLLIVVHGGPTGIDRPWMAADRYYPVERFAAKGALILRPNYRGSAGYGEAFRSLNVRNLGVGDAWDVVSGIDHLAKLGLIGPERVGTMGWSQGGYISAFLATAESSRFKAASVGAGISNWMTYYVNTDIHPFTRMYLKAAPWDDPEIYAKTSPMTYIKQARTPTLIQHGQNDARVPPPNAYELHQGLRDQGTESRLVIYKGFGHGITKPKEMLHVMEENERWFLRHIWGER